MKVYYEEPKLTLSSLELEGFLCGSECYINPIDADVAAFTIGGEATYENDYVLNY